MHRSCFQRTGLLLATALVLTACSGNPPALPVAQPGDLVSTRAELEQRLVDYEASLASSQYAGDEQRRGKGRADDPGHQQLCDAEQAYVLQAIAQDIDLTRHITDAVQSLAICLAADESIRSGTPISLEQKRP